MVTFEKMKKGIGMETEQSIGFFAMIQQKIDKVFASMHITARDVIVYVTCFGLGFIAGVALKRYGKWLVTIALAATIAITALHYFELITVHKDKIKDLLGLYDVHTLDDAVALVHEKASAVWIEIALVCVAIIVGFKLG